MEQILKLKNYFNYKNIDGYVLGNFNNFNRELGLMYLSNGIWQFSINLKDGFYIYKYEIGKHIRINDINAYDYKVDENGEVWSILKIENGQIIYNELKIFIELKNYLITNKVYKTISNSIYKKIFDIKNDTKVAIGINLIKLSCIHSATVIWYQPNACIFHVEEKAIVIPNNLGEVEATAWFWLDLKKINKYLFGLWTIEIYLDGKLSIKDNFIINPSIYYPYSIIDITI